MKKEKKPMKIDPFDAPLDIEEQMRKAFIDGETPSRALPEKDKIYPWEGPGVNDQIIKTFHLRLPEPDRLLLQYVVDNSKYKSIHSFVVEAIMKAARQELKKIEEG